MHFSFSHFEGEEKSGIGAFTLGQVVHPVTQRQYPRHPLTRHPPLLWGSLISPEYSAHRRKVEVVLSYLYFHSSKATQPTEEGVDILVFHILNTSNALFEILSFTV